MVDLNKNRARFHYLKIAWCLGIPPTILHIISTVVSYSQIHPALQQIPAHSTLELCL